MSCARLKRRTAGTGQPAQPRDLAPARRPLVYARQLIVEPLCTSVAHRDGMIAVTSRTVSTTCTSAASSDLSTRFAAALPAKLRNSTDTIAAAPSCSSTSRTSAGQAPRASART